jgi:hypothetical protein
MDNKNLRIQANDSVNSIPRQDLSAEMIELSDEALSQLWGGRVGELWEFFDCTEHFYPDPNPR